jgi:hypothetical protein
MRQPLIKTAAAIFRTMIAPLLNWRNDHGRATGGLSRRSSSAVAAVHRILSAVRNRIHVARSAAHRVAGCRDKRRAKQGDGKNLLEHFLSSLSDGSI